MARFHFNLPPMLKLLMKCGAIATLIALSLHSFLFIIATVHQSWYTQSTLVKRSSGSAIKWPTEAKAACSPQQHIMFLKMHKCASSSLQNIFMRYAVKHNLTLALPRRDHYLGNPRPFMASMIPREQLAATGAVDIFAVHTRLSKSELFKVLHPDTVFVTVVRKPETLYESLYNYAKLNKSTGLSFEEFVDLPLEKQFSFERRESRFGHNMMLFDLGFDPFINTTMFEVRKVIDDADELFHLVLIAEKMDEGLILLKELLCWDFDDIVAFTKNARRDSVKKELSVNAVKKLRDLNSGDALIYSHFLAKHEEAVRGYGHLQMAEQVAFLQRKRQEMFDECDTSVVNSLNSASKDFLDYNEQVDSFVVGPEATTTCRLLSLPELQMVNYARDRQNWRLKYQSLPSAS